MSRDDDIFKTRKFATVKVTVPALTVPSRAALLDDAPPAPVREEIRRPIPRVDPRVEPPSVDDVCLSSTGENGEYDFDRTTERHLIPMSPSGGVVRGVLTVMTGFNAGQTFPVDQNVITLGRGSDADIWIEDAGVSRRHARVVLEGDEYILEDLDSTNGTMVGGVEVRRRVLIPGERIRLGPTAMVAFSLLDDAEEALRMRLFETSTKDALTRIYNRKYFNERLSAEVSHARRHGSKLSLLLIDLDHFKLLNDRYGHLAGDAALRSVAAQVQRLIRAEDLLARYGGEEFVILARSTGKTQAKLLAERIRASIEALDMGDTSCTLSIGVASLPELDASASDEALVALADERLYRAKEQGRNRVCSGDS